MQNSTFRQKWLFNLDPGTQRLCIESRIKLGKIRAIMLSDHNSAAVGGLPGMQITLSVDFSEFGILYVSS